MRIPIGYPLSAKKYHPFVSVDGRHLILCTLPRLPIKRSG